MRSVIGYGFLAPPNILILLSLAGALVTPLFRRVGTVVTLASSLSLFVLATPAASSYLRRCIEAEIPQDTDFTKAQAIVVLGADVRFGRETPDRLGPQSLERLVMTTDAYRRLHLPVAVSGGSSLESQTSMADLMKSALMEYFAIPVTWTEDRSRSTYENALYTARLLHKENIDTIVLITQARDTPRASWSFGQAGIRALAWPAPHTILTTDKVDDFLPSTGALHESFFALHEQIGALYYRLRY